MASGGVWENLGESGIIWESLEESRRGGGESGRAKLSILAEEYTKNEKPVVAWNGKRS